jgi:hypothetical protein
MNNAIRETLKMNHESINYPHWYVRKIQYVSRNYVDVYKQSRTPKYMSVFVPSSCQARQFYHERGRV